jgi:hypothetical protein
LSGVIAHYHHRNHYLRLPTRYHSGEQIQMVETTKYIYTYYLEYHSAFPSPELGPSPASVYPSPEPKEGGTHSPASEGVGETQFARLEKPSTLSTLWLSPKNMLLKEKEGNPQGRLSTMVKKTKSNLPPPPCQGT